MKELINNLRDYAELAQASYFNFMYINNDEREMDSYKIGQNRFPKDKDNIENLEYTKTLSKKYKDYFIYDDSIALYPTLNGEFGEIQAKNFAKKYEIKFHQPNTASGFSATLFYDKEKKRTNNKYIIRICYFYWSFCNSFISEYYPIWINDSRI